MLCIILVCLTYITMVYSFEAGATRYVLGTDLAKNALGKGYPSANGSTNGLAAYSKYSILKG